MSRPPTQQHEMERRLREIKREEAELKQQIAVQKYAGSYEIALRWPAVLSGNQRTSADLIQHRLLEAGLLYDVPIPTADAVAAASQFIANLEASECFHAVHVELGSSTEQDDQLDVPLRSITVRLHEKKWYRLHAGAGLKTDRWLGGSNVATTDSFLPTAEVEITAGLRNIAGCFDRTDVQYTVDTHNIGSWGLTHVRPLYTVLPSALSNGLMEQSTGSQYSLAARAAIDTVDHSTVSNYQQFQRLVTVKAATAEKADPTKQQPWYGSLEWGIVYRDLVPRRHATLPYHLAASPEIVAQAGASVKHGVTAVFNYDRTLHAAADRSGLPVQGVQVQCSTEVAAPPGDVGFVKGLAACTGHASLTDRLALHASLATGYLHAVSFGGLCGAPGVSDRFLLGGTGSFRGFIPAGIGPRSAAKSGALGDALGGNFFYTATAIASLAPPLTIEALDALTSRVRLFGFATAGTCLANLANIRDITGSTRVAAGIGVATNALGPRVEATYAWPLRYGPSDSRRRFQFGMSFSI